MLDRVANRLIPAWATGEYQIDNPLNEDAARHPLRAEGVSYRVGDQTLLSDINLDFSATGISAIMGYNGAGKSLLLRLLNGLLAPSRGKIRWGEAPLTRASLARQAFVFQKPVILRRSVLANMRFALAARKIDELDAALDALEAVGLAHLADQPARLLSGGEKQRLALAQALAVKPEVLLLDEATASLDPASIMVIEDVVQQAAFSGMKVIMVTHDIGQARRMADEIVFVHDRTVVETRAADAFFEGPTSQPAKAYLSGQLPNSIMSNKGSGN